MLREGIDWCSTASVYLELFQNDEFVAKGSGFIVRGTRVYREAHTHLLERPYLITARHCVTGRDAAGKYVGRTGAWPTQAKVWWNDGQSWSSFDVILIRGPEQPAWLEHPQFGSEVDVVAIPLDFDLGVIAKYDPYGIEKTPIAWGVGSELKVIGFPYALDKEAGVPVWTRGTVATEPSVDYNSRPTFLIDGRTRKGQSGSPVVLWSDGTSYPNDYGQISHSPSGSISCLVGVYSGRVEEESDLGVVWKARVLEEIIAPNAPSIEEIKGWTGQQ